MLNQTAGLEPSPRKMLWAFERAPRPDFFVRQAQLYRNAHPRKPPVLIWAVVFLFLLAYVGLLYWGLATFSRDNIPVTP